MKAAELMIGDWVNYTHKYMSKALLCEIVAINNPSGEFILRNLQSNRVDEFGNKDYKVITTRYEDVFPILITPEILKKNGWKETAYWHEYQDGPITIQACLPDMRGILNGVEIQHYKCEYVHQYQHILRLCGLNELAENLII